MQKNIKIKTKDNRCIYGVLDRKNDKDSKLIIFVHGFTGSMNEHQYFNAAPFFNDKGFATFRFNLYGRESDTRKTSNVSLMDHINDTKDVIDHFSSDFKEIYLVGHSLGATVVSMIDKSKVKKIVLWDPAAGLSSPEDNGMRWIKELNAYLCDRRVECLFSKELIEQWMEATVEKQVSSFKVPTKIIFAGNYNKYSQWKDHLKSIRVETDHVIISGASHGFTEEGKNMELYKETYNWLK